MAIREGRRFCRESWPAKLASSLASDSPILGRFLTFRLLPTVSLLTSFSYFLPVQLAFNSGEAVTGDWESRCGLEGLRILADTIILCFREPARNRGEAVREEATFAEYSTKESAPALPRPCHVSWIRKINVIGPHYTGLLGTGIR